MKTKKNKLIDKRMNRALKNHSYGQEMSVAEIASFLGCSDQYVKSLLYSAYKKLRGTHIMEYYEL